MYNSGLPDCSFQSNHGLKPFTDYKLSNYTILYLSLYSTISALSLSGSWLIYQQEITNFHNLHFPVKYVQSSMKYFRNIPETAGINLLAGINPLANNYISWLAKDTNFHCFIITTYRNILCSNNNVYQEVNSFNPPLTCPNQTSYIIKHEMPTINSMA